MMKNKPIALITGATSGIGLACAKRLAKDYHLIICGRRKARLIALADELSEQTTLQCLSFNICDVNEVDAAVASLATEWQKISVLINNAGNAFGLSPMQDGDLRDWENMLDTNVKGLLYMTHAVLPLLLQSQPASIINLGSVAGKSVYPAGNVYCASKFAVDALTQGLRIDLVDTDIRICSVNPGLVETEFSEVRFKGDKARAKTVYEGIEPLHAEDIANIISFVLSQPSHVNISDLTVYPSRQATPTIVARNSEK